MILERQSGPGYKRVTGKGNNGNNTGTYEENQAT
jgi:hypothetical protein